MKNFNYFPFERNKYFYGKLLSVDDFETEQKYMNNKRRIINRFLHGSGVVCGMNVVVIDDRTISLETGLALDSAGREIVVDKPLTKKLSMIEGFDSYVEADEENSNLYLCIDYAENEKDAVHNIAGSNNQGGNQGEYNKYEESYRLYLTNVEPKEDNLAYKSLYEEAITIFWGNGIRIKQVMPKIVESGKGLDLKIIVENMGQQLPISFSYSMELICLENNEKSWATIEFNEENYEKSYEYELTYHFQASAVKEIEGTAIVDSNSFQLMIGGRKVAAVAKGKSSTYIINGSVKSEIISRYYRSAMENISQSSYQHSIYLTKISVIKAGTSYLIEHIQNMPFEQYVYNNIFGAAINDIHMNEIETLKSEIEKRINSISYNTDDKNANVPTFETATGTAILDLGIGGVIGQKFYTEEIAHGLGVGRVNVSLGQAYSLRDESKIVFGSPEIFDDKEATFRAELAAKVDVMNGTFSIGLQLTQPTTVRQVKVFWMVVKDIKENISDKTERNIYIKPDMIYLNLRENYYLKTIFKGISDERVKWYVREEDGGTVDENGMYTAPNKVGVFEVIAESVVYPNIRASAFVAVRSLNEKL